jgi:hypothetical protein
MKDVTITDAMMAGMTINGVPVSDLIAAYEAKTKQEN